MNSKNDKRNKTLAEWLGLRVVTENPPSGSPEMWQQRGIELYTNLGWIDFTQSLDACFKHLVPKVKASLHYKDYYMFLLRWLDEFTLNDSDPALTLCLAVEKQFGLEGGS